MKLPVQINQWLLRSHH